MSFTPAYRCRPYPRGKCQRAIASFTLVELLVAMAVLILLLALLSNLFLMINTTWSNGKQNINNFTKARAALDIMALDYQLGIFRPDVPAFTSGSNTFYSLRQSSSTVGSFARSLICYQVTTTSTNSMLQRAASDASAIPFTQTAVPPATNFLNIVNGVLKMNLTFVGPNGALSTNYVMGDRAVGVDLAIADDITMTQLVTTGKLTILAADPAFNVSTNQTPYQAWQSNFTHSTNAANPINYAGYPASIRNGVQFFERYVPIP